MKAIGLLITFLFCFFSFSKNNELITSNYECLIPKKEAGRCTGSTYCTACRNCSRCAHCSSGGSCGVCSSTTTSTHYLYNSNEKKSKRSRIPKYSSKLSSSKKYYYVDETITIYNDILNLRENPSLESKIIEKITFGVNVVFIEEKGDWIKVRVEESENIGYLYAKNIK
ncbi:hypothetical protein BZL53_03085 [Flavobacterium columnare]|uniref:SH3 domain-containing protein n=1 Tax=Flavobacterium columnare TaxID=996 RepID=UPI000980A970|nr:SH3 domain-containing protein [Flavobacterium columnare]OOB84073.1 hypothetical protein BZL53_03085 [Flavobacterium columnare]